ncbi:MAG: substrate-binding domain-containing protein [Gammaproteobacteria bacterium]|nr:substrate-binding domain-containing protein [Gammaproteobacteria bacterium]
MFENKKTQFTVNTLATTVLLASISLPAFARDQIQIVGSSTVYPFSTLVAERFGSTGKYKTPVIESTGTGGGMKLFCKGIGTQHPDISNASRAIKPSELKNCKKNGVGEIIEVKFGNDGIAFSSSIDAQKFDFTRKQLWTAMAEHGPKPTYWNEIDATFPRTKIAILTPPPTSGTRDAWNAKVMKKGCPADVKKISKKACQKMREDGAVIEAGENDALIVQKLEANNSLFGIFGFGYLENNSDRIQAAKIEGVEISLETIQSYEYPIARPLFFYVKKAHMDIIPGVYEYLNSFASERAISDDGYLIDAGLVPLTEEQRIALRVKAKNKISLK